MTLRIHDNGTDRDMTDKEIAEYKIWQKVRQEETQAEAETQAAKNAARQAVLDKLGLTADEAQALLG